MCGGDAVGSNNGKSNILPPDEAIRLLWGLTSTFCHEEEKDLTKGYQKVIYDEFKQISDLIYKGSGSESQIKKIIENNTKIQDYIKLNRIEIEKKIPNVIKKEFIDFIDSIIKKEGDITGELEELKKSLTVYIEPEDLEYLRRILPVMVSSLRSLHTIYQGREVSFNEIKKIRDAIGADIDEKKTLGTNIKSFITKLPGMSAGGITGYLLAEEYLFCYGDWMKYLIAIIAAGLGYLVQLGMMTWYQRKKRWNSIRLDYERNLFYLQYIERIRETLGTTYMIIHKIHHVVYSENGDYTKPIKDEINDIINNIISGIEPKYCRYIHYHMNIDTRWWHYPYFMKYTKINRWPLCVTGERGCCMDQGIINENGSKKICDSYCKWYDYEEKYIHESICKKNWHKLGNIFFPHTYKPECFCTNIPPKSPENGEGE